MSQDNNDIIGHIMDIKERLSGIESNSKDMRNDIKEHRQESQALNARVAEIKTEIDETRGSVTAIKWVIGVCFALPGFVYAALKIISIP